MVHECYWSLNTFKPSKSFLEKKHDAQYHPPPFSGTNLTAGPSIRGTSSRSISFILLLFVFRVTRVLYGLMSPVYYIAKSTFIRMFEA